MILFIEHGLLQASIHMFSKTILMTYRIMVPFGINFELTKIPQFMLLSVLNGPNQFSSMRLQLFNEYSESLKATCAILKSRINRIYITNEFMTYVKFYNFKKDYALMIILVTMYRKHVVKCEALLLYFQKWTLQERKKSVRIRIYSVDIHKVTYKERCEIQQVFSI